MHYDGDAGTAATTRTLFMGLWFDEIATAAPSVSFGAETQVITPQRNNIACYTDEFSETQVTNGHNNLWTTVSQTMRKLKEGDKIVFLSVCSSDVQTCTVSGFVQLFIKF